MKKLALALCLIALCLISTMASAAKLEDVRVLEVLPGPDKFEFKLQKTGGPKESFFYIDIMKSDPDSFEKLSHVLRKYLRSDEYRLDLDVPSFSASPSGSSYRSLDVKVFGTAVEKRR
jgi:hypothetical protein